MRKDIMSINLGNFTHHGRKCSHGIVRHELHHRIEVSRIVESHIRKSVVHRLKAQVATIHPLHLHALLVLQLVRAVLILCCLIRGHTFVSSLLMERLLTNSIFGGLTEISIPLGSVQWLDILRWMAAGRPFALR